MSSETTLASGRLRSLDSESTSLTIESLLKSGAIKAHKDGNHGSLYPRAEEFCSHGVPFLTAKLLCDGTIDIAGAPRLADDKADKLRLGFVQPGDVLLSHNATIGRVAIVPDFGGRLLIGTSLTYFRLDESKILPRYLAAYFNGVEFQNQLKAVMSQTTRNQVPITAQRFLRVVIPSLATQRAIAATLGALDDRIALLRETNATLEKIAQALFKSWFVDFDPVRAKMEGRAPEGMDEATAVLFPDGFEESTAGPVPKGWHIAALDSITSYLNRGISPKYLEEGGVAVVNQKCIRNFTIDLSKTRRHDPVQRKVDGRELQVGDVLVNSTGVGTLGRVAQVLNLRETTIVDSHVTVVRAKSPITWNFLGLAMMRMQAQIEGMGEGTTGQTELSRGKIALLKLPVPSPGVLLAFDGVTHPLRERFASNLELAGTIADLRDTLLPRLISGQLRLPEAEAQLEALAA